MSPCRVLRAVAALQCVFLIAVSGCSNQPRLGPIGSGERLYISSTVGELTATEKISNEAIKSDAKTGAGGGAVAGAAWGLACGPLAIICAPIGALAGAVVGGTSGAIVGSIRGLNDEQKQQLNSHVAAYLDTNDPALLIYDFLVARASKEWVLVENAADVHELHIEITQISLISKGNDKISLTMSLRADLSYIERSGKRRNKSATFDYQSPGTPIESWIGNHNNFIARRFEDGYLTLTENLVASMLTRAR